MSAAKTKLTTEARELAGKKVKTLRRDGKVPAVVYGPKTTPTNIIVDAKSFRRIFREAGYSSLIDAEVGTKTVKLLVKEVQVHPVTRDIIHASLYAVDMEREIETHIPLRLEGVSPAVKNNIGILSMSVDSIDIKCLPENLPPDVEIDISELGEVGNSIKASDIKLPEGVELAPSQVPDQVLIAIVPPQKEIVEEETVAEGEEGAGEAASTEAAEGESSEA